jgi:DNA-binding winged helix-turn-helix (wHTH) protein
MEVLVYLAQHPDEVLPKERIIRAVWPDTFVTDEVLTNAISELRKAFGDDAKNPQFIQTLPRRGYRLIVEVGRLDSDSGESVTQSRSVIFIRRAG